MSARWWTLLVWALVAASALAWGFRIFVQAPPVPPQALVADAGSGARGDLTRLLGADPAPEAPAAAPEPVPDARFKLIGVLSPRSPKAVREGVALIAVDNKPPRAYRVGALVDGQNVLQAVEQRGAKLGPRDGVATIALTLPPPAPPATGVPSRAGAAPFIPPMAPRPLAMPPVPVATPGAVVDGEPEEVESSHGEEVESSHGEEVDQRSQLR